MARIDECITAKGAEGVVKPEQAEKIAKRFRNAAAEAREKGHIGVQNEIKVAQILQKRALAEAKARKRAMYKQMLIRQDTLRAQDEALAKGKDATAPIYGRIARDPSDSYVGISLYNHQETLIGWAERRLGEFFEKYRPRTFGLRQDATNLVEVAAAAHGDQVSDHLAQAMGKALRDTFEELRVRGNHAGLHIPKRDNWGLPHKWNASRVAKVPKEEFVNDLYGNLKLDEMVDEYGLPMSERDIKEAVESLYDTIKTRGMNQWSILDNAPKTSSISKRAHHRFLQFKSGKHWVEMNTKYGEHTEVYDAIVTGLHSFARDIAEAEVLGPRPSETMRFLENMLERAEVKGPLKGWGKKAAKAATKIGGPKVHLRGLYQTVSGRSSIPVSEFWGNWAASGRSAVLSANMGNAVLSAISDMGTLWTTARMNGVPAARLIGNFVKNFTTGGKKLRARAIRQGFTAQGMASRALGAQRLVGQERALKFFERAADFTLRATGLVRFTEIGRWTWMMDQTSHFTDNIGRSFDRLDKATQSALVRGNISPEEWDLIRTSDLWVDPDSGAQILHPDLIARGKFSGPEFTAAQKMQDLIFNERDFAVITLDPHVQASFQGTTNRGTVGGEVARSLQMLKGFPLSILYKHWGRGMFSETRPMGRVNYILGLAGFMTMTGAFGQQMYELAHGRDPLDMTTPDFWVKAFTRGGSAGMLGDAILGEYGYTQNGLVAALAGPFIGAGQSFFDLTFGNIRDALNDDKVNFGQDLSRFLYQMTPGRSIWYTQVVWQRLWEQTVEDWASNWLGGKPHRTHRKQIRKRRKDYDQQFWSKPGSGTKARLPHFGNILGK